MSSAKRRINSTGRKRIRHQSVDIRMLPAAPGEALKAVATLGLDALEFPVSAAIAIEAYHRSSGVRFDCGTVGAPSIPPVLHLEGIDRSAAVLFRLKVVDTESNPGRLLGSAERIHARSDENDEGRRSLFPLIKRDLGDEIWKVDIEEEARPVLILNSAIAGFDHRILQSPLLQGILLPAALRIVLQKIAEDPVVDDGDETDWKGEWLRYCSDELGVDSDISGLGPDERDEWVEEAVRAFCGKNSFRARIGKMMEGEVYAPDA